MISTIAITNLVLALMIQKPSFVLDDNNVSFRISVETQYVHSVTLHEFDSIGIRHCDVCAKPIILTPIDYLGAKPRTMLFDGDELRKTKFIYHECCNPWRYANTKYLECFKKSCEWRMNEENK